jgi:hypothetical protein
MPKKRGQVHKSRSRRGSKGSTSFQVSGDMTVHGDVVQGDKTEVHAETSAIARGKRPSVTVSTSDGVTVQQFLDLLRTIHSQVGSAGLDEGSAEMVRAHVTDIAQEAKKSRPDKGLVLAGLQKAADVLKASAALVTSGNILATHLQKAIKWAGELF